MGRGRPRAATVAIREGGALTAGASGTGCGGAHGTTRGIPDGGPLGAAGRVGGCRTDAASFAIGQGGSLRPRLGHGGGCEDKASREECSTRKQGHVLTLRQDRPETIRIRSMQSSVSETHLPSPSAPLQERWGTIRRMLTSDLRLQEGIERCQIGRSLQHHRTPPNAGSKRHWMRVWSSSSGTDEAHWGGEGVVEGLRPGPIPAQGNALRLRRQRHQELNAWTKSAPG